MELIPSCASEVSVDIEEVCLSDFVHLVRCILYSAMP